MSKTATVKQSLKYPVELVKDTAARILAYKKKNISLAHAPMLMAHSRVLSQNMKNFTELYGSRWEAIKKMNQIIGGNVQWK